MILRRIAILLSVTTIVMVSQPRLRAGDWPMWRYDAGRTAASPDDLPADLHLQWVREYGPREQVWDDPLNNDVMQYDKVFEPIVLGDRVILGFNDADKVVALDAATGKEVWTAYVDGPVRFPPVGWKGKVFFTSDDGHLYCVRADDGQLEWKFRGGPSDRSVLGNKRVISMWPARGGPVIRDDVLYFAASIWPFMGTFIYAMDPATGNVHWVNDGTGALYHKQPHGAPAFAGVGPQGALVATRDVLLVPGGRSVPAAFDRDTGELLYYRINDGGKGVGGAFVIANDQHYYVHTRQRGVCQFDLKNGDKGKFTLNEPVLAGETMYAATDKAVSALDAEHKVQWQIAADGSGDLVKAGSRLYVAGKDSICAITLPVDGGKPQVAWSTKIDGEVLRLVAGGGKLLAVTLDGRIFAYGSGQPAGQPIQHAAVSEKLPPASSQAQSMLKWAGVDHGYALVFGVDDGSMLDMLLASSDLHIVGFDPDAEKVAQLRRRYDSMGVYGRRVALHQGDPLSSHAPPYIASLVLVGKSLAPKYAKDDCIKAMYAHVRPYGGVLWIPADGPSQSQITQLVQSQSLANAKLLPGDTDLLIFKEGPLPGSAPWTHLYGNIANTVKSDDQLVKPPLGILWFGGSSNLDVLPRHGHGPCEQVIGGRLFIEGMNSLCARDVYTGRVIWKREFKDLGTYGIYFDKTYKNTPLDPAYNQVHLPGANARGTNFVATERVVYLVLGRECLILNAKNGKTVKVLQMPRGQRGTTGRWTYIGVYGDILLGGSEFGNYTRRFEDVKFKTTEKRGNAWSFDWFASQGLVAFNRFTGEVLWTADADHGFLHNGIVAGNGRVYVLDKLPKSVENQRSRRGQAKPETYRLMAMDARTGDVIWETSEKVFGTWLGYSEEHDILLQAGAAAGDRSPEEVKDGMITYRGVDGSIVWEDRDLKYAGPCILHNDLIIANSTSYDTTTGVFSLLTGKPVTITNPVTGKEEPWQYTRTYGCNTAIASEYMLTFRSGAAGYYDLSAKCGVGNFGGFRAGCSSNVIAADGVLNAPDYTRTCSCSYQNQTSLALIHMPDVETWTVSEFEEFKDAPLRQIGINLGAPGDRRATDGTLWLEYPAVAGDSPPLGIDVDGDGLSWFRRHTSAAGGDGLPWVGASGVCNIRRLTLQVTPNRDASTKYTVRLHFAEPDEVAEGQRVFNIAIQGQDVLKGLDIVKAGGGRLKSIMREFPGVAADRDIEITFTPTGDSELEPELSGVEFIAE